MADMAEAIKRIRGMSRPNKSVEATATSQDSGDAAVEGRGHGAPRMVSVGGCASPLR